MTEAEWLTATDPTPMLELLNGKASDRGLRLFSVMCCRRIWEFLAHEKCEKVVKIAEDCAEGTLTLNESYEQGQQLELYCDYDLAKQLTTKTGCSDGAIRSALRAIGLIHGWLSSSQALSIAKNASNAVALKLKPSLEEFKYEEREEFELAAAPFRKVEQTVQAYMIRDIFGNPFRPVALSPSWLTSTVVSLANGIYSNKAFDRMPILADALQDAGCDNEDILNHCRQPGEHTRGCWVVDLVLGKK